MKISQTNFLAITLNLYLILFLIGCGGKSGGNISPTPAPTPVPTPTPIPVIEGLIGYWSFDNADLTDDSGHGHHGKNHGGKFIPGIKGKAIEFNNPDHYGTKNKASGFGNNTCAELADFSLPDSFSISMWINPYDTNDKQCFISKNTPAGENVLLAGYWYDGYFISLNNYYKAQGLKETGFQHLVLVVQKQETTASSLVKVYKNGQLIVEHTLTTIIDNTSNLPWYLGVEWDFNSENKQIYPSNFFNGAIDELRIHNQALAEAEIRRLYNIDGADYNFEDQTPQGFYLKNNAPILEVSQEKAYQGSNSLKLALNSDEDTILQVDSPNLNIGSFINAQVYLPTTENLKALKLFASDSNNRKSTSYFSSKELSPGWNKISLTIPHLSGSFMEDDFSGNLSQWHNTVTNTIENGQFKVSNNEYVRSKIGKNWDNYTFEVDITIVNLAAGLTFRAQDKANYYLWQFLPGRFSAYKKINNIWHLIKTKSTAISVNTQYRVKIELQGSSIKTYVNNHLIDETIDGQYTKGNLGFRQWESETALFDNVKVYRENSGEPLVGPFQNLGLMILPEGTYQGEVFVDSISIHN